MDDAVLPAASSCRHCRRQETLPIGTVTPTNDADYARKEYTLQYCANCDVVYLDPLPTPDDLRMMYEEAIQFSDAHYTDPERVAAILDYYSTALSNLRLLGSGHRRVLEVGAGLAWVSRAGKMLRPDVTTIAQDVSGECASACPWVDRYFIGPLDALPQQAPFDLVSLTHVIEHLVDPLAMLRQLAALLSHDGEIFITAPFRPSEWRPESGFDGWREYSYLHVPAHITYLSRRWFDLFAPLCGLRVRHWDVKQDGGQAFELVLART